MLPTPLTPTVFGGLAIDTHIMARAPEQNDMDMENHAANSNHDNGFVNKRCLMLSCGALVGIAAATSLRSKGEATVLANAGKRVLNRSDQKNVSPADAPDDNANNGGNETASDLEQKTRRMPFANLAAAYHSYKVIVVGDAAVGKTHLLSRYMKGSPPSAATTRVEFATCTVPPAVGGTFKAKMWDTAGQERYHAITGANYKRPVGALLVYDITKSSTFKHCAKWLEILRRNAEPGSVIMLVGNKVDLVEDDSSMRQVPYETAAKFAREHRLLFSEASAVTSDSAKHIFDHLLKKMYKRFPTGSGGKMRDVNPMGGNTFGGRAKEETAKSMKSPQNKTKRNELNRRATAEAELDVADDHEHDTASPDQTSESDTNSDENEGNDTNHFEKKPGPDPSSKSQGMPSTTEDVSIPKLPTTQRTNARLYKNVDVKTNPQTTVAQTVAPFPKSPKN